MPPARPLCRAVSKCALGVVSLSVCLSLAEGFARVFLPEVSDSFVVQTESLDAKYHHKPLWGVLPEPDPEAYRIAFLGDSFTHGYPIKDRDEAFPAVVGRLLNERTIGRVGVRRVQSYNLGTPSYSPSIYGVALREITPALRPHLVVVGLDDSDPQDDLLYQPLLVADPEGLPVSVHPGLPGVPGWLKPLARRIKLVRLSFGLGDKVYRRFVVQEPRALKRWENRLGHYRPGPGTDAEWARVFEHTLSLVAAMKAHCDDRGITFCVVNYPYPPAVSTTAVVAWRKNFHFGKDRLYEPSFHVAVRAFCERRAIPYHDFTPIMRSLPDHKDLFLSDDDPHYSPRGHAALARSLVPFLSPLVDGQTVHDYDRSHD
ncbi:MAG: hypothetical protein AB7I30_08330 [Isosphaeraceae bacterium]